MTVTVTAAAEYVANFEEIPSGTTKYTVTINAENSTIASGTTGEYEQGTPLTLTAYAWDGYTFDGWYLGEERVSTEQTINITVEGNATYTAKSVASTTYYNINVVVNGTLVNNKDVKAVISYTGQEFISKDNVSPGTYLTLIATEDFEGKAYLFEGWYLGDECVSTKTEHTFEVSADATYEARFIKGYVVKGRSDSNKYGYVGKVTYADGTPCVGTATDIRAVVRANDKVKFYAYVNYGCEVTSWKDENGNTVGTSNDLVVEVTSDNTYTAYIEPITYLLSVSVDGEGGSVEATCYGNTGAEVKVGNNMPATISATPADGYVFSHWTLNGKTVKDADAEYEVPVIAEYENMADVEYVAHFKLAGSLEPGYYRIAYEFPVEQAAALTAATRAATGSVEYVISSSTGTTNNGTNRSSKWTNSTLTDLTMTATDGNGNLVNTIETTSKGYCLNVGAKPYSTTYTVAVPEDSKYTITGYEIDYTSYSHRTYSVFVKDHNNNEYETANNVNGGISGTDLDVKSFSFVVCLNVTNGGNTYGIDINSFKVYIKEASETPETPTVETKKLYVQSVACENKVLANPNALLMNEEKGAASIFYFDGNSLLSYSKGLYVKEDGTARGLLAAGEKNENVVITASTEEGKYIIKAPNYLHANINVGTSTTYFVDHCGTEATATCSDESRHQFIIETVDSLPVTISGAGYATFYAPVAVEVPAGLEAYYLAEGGLHADYASMTKIEGAAATDPVVVPAYTGIIFTGNNGGTATAGNYNLAITTTDDEIESLLGGTVATEYVLGGDENDNRAYYLAMPKVDDVQWPIGFYKAKLNTDNEFLNNGHKSYLPMDVVSGDLQNSYGFRFLFGTTGIDGVASEETPEGIYDLQGRKLEGIPGAGIYIVNGKKVLVK